MIVERTAGDVAELRLRLAAERDALRRDRYRAVVLAIEGKQASDIAASLGRARRSVQDWAYAYREGGVDAIQPKPRLGRVPKLPRDREAALKARLDAGPTPEDCVCTLRGKDVVRILESEFGVKHTIGSIYGVLERIGYACLAPRPRHEKNDPAAIERFKTDAPFLSSE